MKRSPESIDRGTMRLISSAIWEAWCSRIYSSISLGQVWIPPEAARARSLLLKSCGYAAVRYRQQALVRPEAGRSMNTQEAPEVRTAQAKVVRVTSFQRSTSDG